MRNSIAAIAAPLLLAAGCAATSSSTLMSPGTPVAKWEGPVFVTQQPLPAGVEHQVIGSVSADSQSYDSVTTLYPALAAEARKIGANAVVSAKGARKVSALSWSAPYATGIAVRVKDPQKLKGLEGSSY